MSCAHHNFSTESRVCRLEDSGRFMLELRIRCTDCDLPFQFVGLPPGLNLSGATVSVDAQEANLAIAPAGTVACFLDEVQRAMGGTH